MKSFAAVALIMLSTTALAQSVGARDVGPMLQQMQAAGKITPEQAAITRRYMEKMSPEDWKRIENRAQKAIQRNPAAAERVGKEGVESLNMNEFNFAE